MTDDTAKKLRAVAEDLLCRSIGEAFACPPPMSSPVDFVRLTLAQIRHMVHASVEAGYRVGLFVNACETPKEMKW